MKLKSFLISLTKYNKAPLDIKKALETILRSYEVRYITFTEGDNYTTALNLLAAPKREIKKPQHSKVEVFRGSTFIEVNTQVDNFLQTASYERIQLYSQSSSGKTILMIVIYTLKK